MYGRSGYPPNFRTQPRHRRPAVERRRYPRIFPHVRENPRARRTGRNRTRLRRVYHVEPLQPGDSPGTFAPAGQQLRPGASAGRGQGRYQGVAPMARGCRVALEEGRVRHYLCVCRTRSLIPDAFSVAAPQLAHRRVWWQPGKPGAVVPGNYRRDQAGRRRHLRRCGPLRRR